MAYRCGHCRERHDTVEEGRECAVKKQTRKASPDLPKFLQEAVEEQYEGLTAGAQVYLRDLLKQFGLVLAGDQTIETIDYRAGKKILNGMIDARRLKTTGKPYALPDGVFHDPAVKTAGEREPTPRKLPDCPPGYYAVADWTRKEELKFFRVRLIHKGKWKGATFIDQVIGGHPNQPARGKFAVEAIEAILDMGPEAAGLLFALRMKQCWNCRRHLTKKASRQLGLGRNCAFKKGKGQEWDDLNWDYNDADADDDD